MKVCSVVTLKDGVRTLWSKETYESRFGPVITLREGARAFRREEP